MTLIFVLVLDAWPVLGLPIAVLVVLTREIGLVLVLTASIVLLWKGRRALGIVLSLVGILSWWVLLPNLAPSGSNLHNLPDAIFLVGKSFAAFLKNFLGFQIWTNSFAELWTRWGSGGCREPLVAFDLPGWIRLGKVSSVGLCPWDPGYIATFLAVYLCGWGVVPGMSSAVWRYGGCFLRKASPGIASGVIFGLIMFAITPFVGYGLALGRYSLYAVIPAVTVVPQSILGHWRGLGTAGQISMTLVHIFLMSLILAVLWGLIGSEWLWVFAGLGGLSQLMIRSCMARLEVR